ncbi:MAG TPA: GNAT family protein [Steroidobacteraceae bacterium]|nr:GNAT family protein [Steroidobacteraceae bacterium]
MITRDLKGWAPRSRPNRTILDGRYCRLEPLDAARHGEDLFEASSVPDAAERFRWLFEYPPESRAGFQPWLDKAQSSDDPLFFAVLDKASGKAAGRQALMRIDTAHGVIEIGSIYWGPLVSRRPAATEALYLFAQHVFDELGYRRFEWKCHDLNGPSKRAAARFGFKFEGVFRQHMVFKGGNRDTAWFSITDGEWPALRRAYAAWLDPGNFDPQGGQKRRLEQIRAELAAA